MTASTLNHLDGLICTMQLKDRINEAMQGSGLTKAGLARATGATPGAITQWLTGETKSLKGETAAKIEAATGYRSGWIVSGTGPKKIVLPNDQQETSHTERVQASTNAIASPSAAEFLLMARWLDQIADSTVRLVTLQKCMQIVLEATQSSTSQPTPDTVKAESQETQRAGCR